MIATGRQLAFTKYGPWRWERVHAAHAARWCAYAALALVGASWLEACGSPLEGSYAGTLQDALTCPNGSSTTGENAVLDVAVVGDTASIGGVCPGRFVVGTVRGRAVELGLGACAPVDLGNGLTGTLTIAPSSHLSLAGGSLAVALDGSLRVDADGSTYTGTATCTETFTGVLSPEGE